MRVLMISLDKDLLSATSRTTKRLLPISERLDKLVVVLPNISSGKVVLSENLSIYACGSRFKPWGFLKALMKVINLQNRHKLDLISAQDPFFCGLLAFLVAKIVRTTWHLQIHGNFFSSWWKKESLINIFKYRLMIFLVHRVPSIRVVSQKIKNGLIKNGVKSDVVMIIPVVENENDNNYRSNQRTNDLLFVGRFSKEKNLPLLIRAFAEVVVAHPETKLCLVGTGPELEKIENLISELSLNKSVIIKGWSNDIANIYSQAGILVLPSFYEGWPRVIIEAINFGLAVVMTDVGSAGELIINMRNGLVVKVNDQDGLTQAINLLLDSPDLKNIFVNTARDDVKKLPKFNEILENNLTSWKKAFKK